MTIDRPFPCARLAVRSFAGVCILLCAVGCGRRDGDESRTPDRKAVREEAMRLIEEQRKSRVFIDEAFKIRYFNIEFQKLAELRDGIRDELARTNALTEDTRKGEPTEERLQRGIYGMRLSRAVSSALWIVTYAQDLIALYLTSEDQYTLYRDIKERLETASHALESTAADIEELLLYAVPSSLKGIGEDARRRMLEAKSIVDTMTRQIDDRHASAARAPGRADVKPQAQSKGPTG